MLIDACMMWVCMREGDMPKQNVRVTDHEIFSRDLRHVSNSCFLSVQNVGDCGPLRHDSQNEPYFNSITVLDC
jgi:hypothetical protein